MSDEIKTYEGEIEDLKINHKFGNKYVAEVTIKALEYPFKTGLMSQQEAQNYFVEYKVGDNIWIQIEKNPKGFWEITKKAAAAPKMETAKELNEKEKPVVSEETLGGERADETQGGEVREPRPTRISTMRDCLEAAVLAYRNVGAICTTKDGSLDETDKRNVGAIAISFYVEDNDKRYHVGNSRVWLMDECSHCACPRAEPERKK